MRMGRVESNWMPSASIRRSAGILQSYVHLLLAMEQLPTSEATNGRGSPKGTSAADLVNAPVVWP